MAVTLSLAITQNSQNIANNTSNVTVKATVAWTNGSWNSLGQCSGHITIDGAKYEFSGMSFNSSHITTGSQVVMTKTVDVKHKDDGSKVLSCSSSFNTVISAGTVSASASKTLTTIARASQPSCITWPEHTQDVGDFGTEISIHMNRKSDSFTHTVRYAFGSASGTCINAETGKATNKDVGTGFKWKIPVELMNLIPETVKGSGTIYVDTYNGSTKIGTKSCGFTATVPASVEPSCSFTLDDITGVDDIYGSPVKGLSKIKITVSTTQAYSSPIASCLIKANGVQYTGTTATTGELTTSGTSTVTATVTDKRGRSYSVSYDMSVQDYTPPSISKLTVKRCDANGTENDKGEYCQVTFSAAVSSMSSKNTASYKINYRKITDSSWTSVLIVTSNKYTVTDHTYIFAANGNSSYEVEVTATDRHGTATRLTTVSTAFTLINFHPDGTGIRFGGVSEEANTLQNDLALCQVGNTYAFHPSHYDGAAGYVLLAVITITEYNADAPIVFVVNKRGALCPMTVYVRFASSSSTKDPALSTISYEGDNLGCFLVKTATSTWKLYVDNTTGWKNPCLHSWHTTASQMLRISVAFPKEMVSGSDPSVLGSYYRATPAKMQSLIDFIYPVGSIYWGYSHTSPASLFGGTWTRINNAFLWAVDSSGTIGQTGGSKEHTLTVDELPSHSHGSVYSGMVSGTKNTAWLASGGDKMAYGALYAGGGKAHNNMPPYIQVSAWRRTE